MNDEHFKQVKAIVERSNQLAKELTEKLGLENAIDPLFKECNKLWQAQFPKSKGWGKSLHLDLGGADFSGALFACGIGSLEGATFKNAILDGTRWLLVNIGKADFTHVTLKNSNFTSCMASAADFSGASLSDASINISSTPAANFTGADLCNADITLGTISPFVPTHFFYTDLILTGADMAGCRIGISRTKLAGSVRERGEQLYRFLHSLSDEQRRQVTFKEPTLQPQEPSKCFIATAVYGSALAPQVQLLQTIRQEYLQPHWLGRLFVRAYYEVSPLLADWIRKLPRVQRLIRRILEFALVIMSRRL